MKHHLLPLLSLFLFSCAKNMPYDEVMSRVDNGAMIIDARSAGEYERNHIKGAVHIEYTDIADNLDRIPRDKDVLLYCFSGHRSKWGMETLKENGYTRAYNAGTISDLQRAGLETE